MDGNKEFSEPVINAADRYIGSVERLTSIESDIGLASNDDPSLLKYVGLASLKLTKWGIDLHSELSELRFIHAIRRDPEAKKLEEDIFDTPLLAARFVIAKTDF